MNCSEASEKLIIFWNDFFKDLKPCAITKEDIKIENLLDELLQFLGDNCQRVLDIGCGTGTCLIQALLSGCKLTYGFGFDTSQNAVNFALETCKLSGIGGLEYATADHTYMENLHDESFDGIFCSNFLDVIPVEISDEVIKHVKRILKPGGYFLLKLNFYLTPQLIEKIKMTQLSKNTYAINGVFRAVNRTTQEWISLFDGFETVKIGEYERVPKIMDRVILMQKKIAFSF